MFKLKTIIKKIKNKNKLNKPKADNHNMDHNNMHQQNTAALHWSYGAGAIPTTPQNHWVPPPQTHNSLKRSMSESDCEELYSEESSKEQ